MADSDRELAAIKHAQARLRSAPKWASDRWPNTYLRVDSALRVAATTSDPAAQARYGRVAVLAGHKFSLAVFAHQITGAVVVLGGFAGAVFMVLLFGLAALVVLFGAVLGGMVGMAVRGWLRWAGIKPDRYITVAHSKATAVLNAIPTGEVSD